MSVCVCIHVCLCVCAFASSQDQVVFPSLPLSPPACSPLESLSSSDDEELQRVTNSVPPKVVLNSGENEEEDAHKYNTPPVLRRAKFRKAATSPSGSPRVGSPETSPSPRTTPRGSPVNSPRGVRKFIKRGKVGIP